MEEVQGRSSRKSSKERFQGRVPRKKYMEEFQIRKISMEDLQGRVPRTNSKDELQGQSPRTISKDELQGRTPRKELRGRISRAGFQRARWSMCWKGVCKGRYISGLRLVILRTSAAASDVRGHRRWTGGIVLLSASFRLHARLLLLLYTPTIGSP